MIDYYASYVSLPHRQDRKDNMAYELKKAGITAVETRGMYPNEYTGDESKVLVQRNRTPGSIGCMISQMKVMLDAYNHGKAALVMEDDLHFAATFPERFAYLCNFLETRPTWDIGWLGGTIHLPEAVWHRPNNPDLPNTTLNKDAEPTEDPRIIRCYGAFCTYAYLVRYDSIEKVLRLLDEVMHVSIGIDFSMILLGDKLETYMMLPGMVRQIDNQSDIGNGMTYFSGFEKLGRHWFAEDMNDFDPATINWNI